MSSELLTQGVEVMLLGLGGVFAVLILFYCMTKIMLVISKRAAKKNS